MKDILDKISSYNIFNYLFPGVVFAVFLNLLTDYNLLGEDLIVNAFVVYFAGLAISRFGSLVIEPILKKVSFLKFVDYSLYVSASKKDTKLELLSEVNNTYRTLNATFILILIIKAWTWIEFKYSHLNGSGPYLLLGLLLVMFLYSYKKQTEYVVKRVKANSK